MGNEFTDWTQYSWLVTGTIIVCAFIFTILLLLDVYKAFRMKAHWIRVEAMVLNALVIQLITFNDNLSLNVNSEDIQLKDYQLDFLIEYPLGNYIPRVMICILIGYLLPRVVSASLTSVWGDIGTLALIVIWHMGYEVYFLLKVVKEEKSLSPPPPSQDNNVDSYSEWPADRVCFIVSYIAIFTTLILLVMLLTGAVVAGKSIRKLMSQKVPLALSRCCSYPEKQECNIENHVLKCWIMTRASQPDYIIARSVFSAFAGLVIAVLFGFTVFLCNCNWYVFTGYFKSSMDRWVVSDIIFYFLQFVFIVLGLIVVLFRWFTAVIYFPRDASCLFYLEDFWTRNIVDTKNALDAHLTAKLLHKKGNLDRPPTESIGVYLITTFRLHSLLVPALWLQKGMVSCSKACWYLSDILLRDLRPLIMSPEENELLRGFNLEETHPFNKYKEALEVIRMPGEKASSLWIANLSAFKKAEDNMIKGFQNNKDTCTELINFMRHKTGMVEDETPTSLEDEKYFQEVGKKSWKMRAVSLIHFMVYFYDGTNFNVVNDAIQACSQAWYFMDIVDNLDPKGHLVSRAADKEFDNIKIIWNDHLNVENSHHNQSNENVPNKLLEKKIKSPLKHHMEQLCREESASDRAGLQNKCVDNLHDSKDWLTVAAQISLYKIWKNMDLNSNSVNAINHLRCLLANIIDHCIGKELDRALIENCGKWAEDGKETEIFNAAFIVGKANAVRDRVIRTSHSVRDQNEVVAREGNDISRSEAVEGGGNDISQSEAVEREGNEISEVEARVEGEGNEAVHSRVEAVEGSNALNNQIEAIESERNDRLHEQVSSHSHAIVEVEDVGEEESLS